MARRIGFCCLHYGKDFLPWAIKAAQEVVEEIHVIYSDRPSFGHRSNLACPDSEDDLKRAASKFLQKPMFWHKGNFPNEGAHREAIFPVAKEREAEQILVFDSDEIFDPKMAKEALDAAAAQPAGRVLMRFMHFYRSFKWVNHDPCMPVRILNLGPDGRPKPGEWYMSPQLRPVWHFGYMQTFPLMKYKWAIHGHLTEMKPNWFEEKYANFQPGITIDVHPCNGWNGETKRYFWEPEKTDEETRKAMEPILGDHPWFNEDLIS